MNEDKVIKVSDWSQKYKLVIYAISGVGLIILGVKFLVVLYEIKDILQKMLLSIGG